MNRHCYFWIASAIAAAGCHGTQPDAVPILRASAIAQGQSPDQPLRDEPAISAYNALAASFSNGVSPANGLNVYQLEPPAQAASVLQRWTDEGAVGAKDNPSVADEHRPTVSAIPGPDQELQFNALSGAELWVNRALFHKETGVDRSTLASEASFVQKARAHVLSTLAESAAKLPLYAYKTRLYFNSVGSRDSSLPVTTTIYQAAVAFNTSIDNLPVIGPGGKISVQMAPDGTPVQHESTVRGLQGILAPVPANSIIPPGVARADLEKALVARGVHLDQYQASRSEFGYFRRGAGSVQDVIGPYYAFFYDPVSGQHQKSIEEHVPATNDPTALKLLQDDENHERARKAVLIASAGPPGQRRPAH